MAASRQARTGQRAPRGKGEGSCYQRADGRWVAQAEAGRSPDGRRRYTRAVRATKTEALRALRELQRQADSGVTPDNASTVAAYLAWWADNVLAGSVKESTDVDYRAVIDRYVIPHIGKVRLARLTAAHVQTMLRQLEARGLSPRTRQYARAVLVRALRWAERNGLVGRNVAALVEGPRLGRQAKLDDAMTTEQVKAVLDAAKGDRLEALAVLVLSIGLRRGEALALRWPDIDLDAKTLTVAGTLKYRPGSAPYIDRPKTAAGRRTIPLLEGLRSALVEHRRRQAAERLALGRLWHDTGHVFTAPDGRPLTGSMVQVWWRRLCTEAGVGHRRFHATRHTAATLLLDQGVPLEVVSAILGHAGLAITADVYARVTSDAKRRALASIEALDG